MPSTRPLTAALISLKASSAARTSFFAGSRARLARQGSLISPRLMPVWMAFTASRYCPKPAAMRSSAACSAGSSMGRSCARRASPEATWAVQAWW